MLNTMGWITWVAATVSFYATWINADKNRLCWVLWMFTNTFWAIHFVGVGDYAPAALQVGYCGLSVRGFLLWKPRKETNTDGDHT